MKVSITTSKNSYVGTKKATVAPLATELKFCTSVVTSGIDFWHRKTVQFWQPLKVSFDPFLIYLNKNGAVFL